MPFGLDLSSLFANYHPDDLPATGPAPWPQTTPVRRSLFRQEQLAGMNPPASDVVLPGGIRPGVLGAAPLVDPFGPLAARQQRTAGLQTDGPPLPSAVNMPPATGPMPGTAAAPAVATSPMGAMAAASNLMPPASTLRVPRNPAIPPGITYGNPSGILPGQATPAKPGAATPLDAVTMGSPALFGDLDTLRANLAKQLEDTRPLPYTGPAIMYMPGGAQPRPLYGPDYYDPGSPYNQENARRAAGRQAVLASAAALPSLATLEGHRITGASQLAQKSADTRGELTKLLTAKALQNPDAPVEQIMGDAEIVRNMQNVLTAESLFAPQGMPGAPSADQRRQALIDEAKANIRKARASTQAAARQEDYEDILRRGVPGATVDSQGNVKSVGALNAAELVNALREHPKVLDRPQAVESLATKLANAPGSGGPQKIMEELEKALIRYASEAGLREVGGFTVNPDEPTGFFSVPAVGVHHPLGNKTYADPLRSIGVSPFHDITPTWRESTKSDYRSRAKAITPLLEALYRQHPGMR